MLSTLFGPFRWLFRPALLALVVGGVAAGCVIGVWRVSGRSIWYVFAYVVLATYGPFWLAKWGLRRLNSPYYYRRYTPGRWSSLWATGTALAISAVACVGTVVGLLITLSYWLRLPSDVALWLRTIVVVAAFPPVRWILNRLTPAPREMRSSANLSVLATDRPPTTNEGSMLSREIEFTIRNRGHHEVRNVHVVLDNEWEAVGGPSSDMILPGQSIVLSETRTSPPNRIVVVFSDWQGQTWVHCRSIYLVMDSRTPVRRSRRSTELPPANFPAGYVKPADMRLTMYFVGSPIAVLWERRGLTSLGISVSEYIDHQVKLLPGPGH